MTIHGWIDWRDCNPAEIVDVPIAARPVGNQGTKQKKNILDIVCAWDIETSRIADLDQSFCYQWQMQCGTEYPTIRGREMWEFRACLDRFAEVIEKGTTLYLFVHNLSYEFCYLRSVFPDISPKDVFALDKRKVAKVKLYGGKIELRCSYIMTNMSLGEFTKKMKVEHQKLSGDDFDYFKMRYPWDELTADELLYCQNDVLGLVEAIMVYLQSYNETLANVTLTSTGHVRKDVKRVMRNWSYRALQAVQPSPQVYVRLREAFRGGNTHNNRFYAGVIVEDANSADKSSAYPDADVNFPFPMGTFRKSPRRTLTWIKSRMTRNYALLITMKWTNLRLADKWDPCPYVPFAKVRGCKVKDCFLDNGRILYAPVAEMTFTDLDWQIIEKQYVWDSVEIVDMYETRYGFLPDVLRNLIISYYEDKTTLKGVVGQEVYYTKSKNLLNSIYGLQAQDPCKESVIFDEDYTDPDTGHPELFHVEEGDIPALLEKSQRQPYGSYQWGVWTTARTRLELQKIIWAAGDDFLYCDTDSVKYLGDISEALAKYNRAAVKRSTANGALATDPAGTTHYMGVFEDDGHYKRFVSLGAKKYAYEDDDGHLHITVAGVGKKKGAVELKAAGGLEAFQTGLIFRDAGGSEAIYNDRICKELNIDGHTLVLGPNLCLKPSTYTLKASSFAVEVSEDFEEFLRDADVVRTLIHERNIKKALSAAGTKNNT